VLRLLSFLLGRRLTALLKQVLIFKQGGGGPRLNRSVSRRERELVIVDRITGLTPSDRLVRAPRASKRHVASADSFHRQDLATLSGYRMEEERREMDGSVEIETRYIPH
jgi:hypothetical protein